GGGVRRRRYPRGGLLPVSSQGARVDGGRTGDRRARIRTLARDHRRRRRGTSLRAARPGSVGRRGPVLGRRPRAAPAPWRRRCRARPALAVLGGERAPRRPGLRGVPPSFTAAIGGQRAARAVTRRAGEAA